jgi:hypothetical protein
MRAERIVLCVLGVWRVTHLLHAEDGPWGLLRRARGAAAGWAIGDLLGCFWCASLWVAAPFSLLGGGWRERLALWPALSAGAILVQDALERSGPPPAVHYNEDEEVDDGMLRTS